MFKFVVFFALASCAFATLFTPTPRPCAYHVFVDEYSNTIMMSNDRTGYARVENTVTHSHEIYRCDIRNENEDCLYIRDFGEDGCEVTWTTWTNESLGTDYNMTFIYNALLTPFEYSGEPEPVDCPVYELEDGTKVCTNGTSKNCKKYWNDDKSLFIIADDAGRLVYTLDTFTVAYPDDEVDPSVFIWTMCNETKLDSCEDVCESGSSSVFSLSFTSMVVAFALTIALLF